MKKKQYIYSIILGLSFKLFFILFAVFSAKSEAKFSNKVFEKAKKGIVSIHANASLAAFGNNIGCWQGTGFVIDKKQGIIMTNAHVVGKATIGTYSVVFCNGKKIDAKLMYYDPWIDYAFLKVNSKDIPHNVEAITISQQNPTINQPIFIIGNNQGQQFSMHTGCVANLHNITGAMPQHAIQLSLNTKGGSSGSPIFDQKGRAIALNFASNSTFAIAIHPTYLRYAVQAILKNTLPKRQHIGVITAMYSLNEATKFRHFSKDMLKKYMETYPDTYSNAIQVIRTLKGSPAEGKLLPGDIIWAINDQEIGPYLSKLDILMSNSTNAQVKITIVRNGTIQHIEIPLYNLEDHKINKIVSFGGALFFEADDYITNYTGIIPKSLTMIYKKPGTSFSNTSITSFKKGVCVLQIQQFDTQPVDRLQNLIKVIPSLIQKKYFTMNYVNQHMYYANFGIPLFNHDLATTDITYNTLDPLSCVYIFDDNSMEWKIEHTFDSLNK